MIPFFRRIRKNLADKNQFLKYARYAIGEIVLVVIGILIALQINTWNEHRKERALEQDYYCRLLEDVMLDNQQVADLLNESLLLISYNQRQIMLFQQIKEEIQTLTLLLKTKCN
jgi:hypothetical protein